MKGKTIEMKNPNNQLKKGEIFSGMKKRSGALHLLELEHPKINEW